MQPFSLPRTLERELASNDNDGSFLVDKSGNDYEPYALAWRYLGMYIDCDTDQQSDDVYSGDQQGGSGDGNDCARKLLWAAYRDPFYRGGQIGEYQFLNWQKSSWDRSTCRTWRCAKINCHEAWSRYQLIGVFKQTDGLYDWAEQLFKHEGYCVWGADQEDGESGDSGDDSDYNFMQERLENWRGGECTELSVTDSSGNTIYVDTKPLPGGNMTYGVYEDDRCSQESSLTFGDYLVRYYETYYYDEEKGYDAAAYWDSVFARWNELMTAYKVCQPCRAYSRVLEAGNEESGDDGGNEDGGGARERWGYNCYDDAGYTNCNQCYKFETKTDMGEASIADLERASSQGTILAIHVGKKVYGHGGYNSSWGYGLHGTFTSTFAALSFFLILGCFLGKKPLIQRLQNRIKHYRRRAIESKDLKEVLTEISGDITVQSEQFFEDNGVTFEGCPVEEVMSVLQRNDGEEEELRESLHQKEVHLDIKQAEVEHLRMALDMEQMMHELERKRLEEENEQLQAQLTAHGIRSASKVREALDCSRSLTETDIDVMEVWSLDGTSPAANGSTIAISATDSTLLKSSCIDDGVS